jgi:hypothetical protein
MSLRNIREFDFYSQYPPTHRGTTQTADGTSQHIKRVGTLQWTPNIKLSSDCMFLLFLSLSALIDQQACHIMGW